MPYQSGGLLDFTEFWIAGDETGVVHLEFRDEPPTCTLIPIIRLTMDALSVNARPAAQPA